MEPIDPVAGTFPGRSACHLPTFVRQDGTWLPLKSAGALLEKVLGATESRLECHVRVGCHCLPSGNIGA